MVHRALHEQVAPRTRRHRRVVTSDNQCRRIVSVGELQRHVGGDKTVGVVHSFHAAQLVHPADVERGELVDVGGLFLDHEDLSMSEVRVLHDAPYEIRQVEEHAQLHADQVDADDDGSEDAHAFRFFERDKLERGAKHIESVKGDHAFHFRVDQGDCPRVAEGDLDLSYTPILEVVPTIGEERLPFQVGRDPQHHLVRGKEGVGDQDGALLADRQPVGEQLVDLRYHDQLPFGRYPRVGPVKIYRLAHPGVDIEQDAVDGRPKLSLQIGRAHV